MAGLAGGDDALGHSLDAVGVGHRGSTVLLDDKRHGRVAPPGRAAGGLSVPTRGTDALRIFLQAFTWRLAAIRRPPGTTPPGGLLGPLEHGMRPDRLHRPE